MNLMTGSINLTRDGFVTVGTMATMCQQKTPVILRVGLPLHGAAVAPLQAWVDNLVVETK